MDISLEELAKLSSEEIYKRLSSFFDNLYNANSFYGMPFSEFKKIILDEIEISKDEYSGNVDYAAFLKKSVIRRIKADYDHENTSIISNYIKDIEDIEYYDKSIEDDLILKAQNGDIEARNMIIENYLKLVINIAKRYLDKGLAFEDLIQEGNMGLIKAIKKYDKTKGSKFSTYAVWWIRQSITRSIANKGKTIRIPVHLYEKLSIYKRTFATLELELGRKPTEEEIANRMNISLESLAMLDKLGIKTSSLNEKIYEEQDVELEAIIPNDDPPVDIQTIVTSMKTDVADLMKTVGLTERELAFLRFRNGFDGKDPKTLEQVGSYYGITRERVRQIEKVALYKLIGYKNIYDYIGYMDSPEKAFKKIKRMNTCINNKKREKKYHVNEEIIYNPETEKVERRKVKTIYYIFNEYPIIKVNVAFSRLNILDQLFVYYRYGGHLEEPYIFELTDKQKEYFDNVIIPRMREILSKINHEELLKYAKGEALTYNSVNSFDLYAFNDMIDKYINSGISFYLSINQFFIKVLREGYINNKVYTKQEVQTILHLDDDDYEMCINEEKEIYEDKENDANIKKILKKI